MSAIFSKLSLMVGILALTVSCTTENARESNPSQSATEVANITTTEIIKIDGSSTVHPITEAIAKDFQAEKQTPVNVEISGTTGGFEKFCNGETDIANASRPILKKELKTCTANGVMFTELPIAFDAVTVVVNPQNDWAKDIKLAELKKIWQKSAEGKITNWNQIRASFPDLPLKLYGADNKSGTYDYFTKAVIGKSGNSRNDYTASENDDDLVAGVSQNKNALGYFGYAYYEENKDKLKPLAIDNGKGAVLPSRETVEKTQYQPLSRPLFIYVNTKSAQKKPALRDFVNFYIEKAPTKVSSVGYVPLPEDAYYLDKVQFNRGKLGTVFEGEARLNLTIDEVLRKRAEF
ncbi:phosphate ABC transporter substrate-binding protein, PhoT family [Rivularia sp. PCC 7116]|uniref:PstS family phosphate ABC transporter substrate-binding protein n=1 Tax=Rivularia sp. PCC 7116 TaxID=373994 RepID=UPI00029EEC99|nr:PstS family phosphate ABC transporter substrate-binding protein [Rivularia sp. PCC 7116]AFY59064.1 phosphate ABC transporter substrate-binding protein, PhoT family [Rivularia sp. PCC 7116]